MSEKELKQRIEVKWKGYGSYLVTILYRNKSYSCTSHNSLAYDDMDSEPDNRSYYTSKQAYKALWYECCRNNNIGRYKSR